MKMAKASDGDLAMAMDLCNTLDTFESGFFTVDSQRHDDESFDTDSGDDCRRAMEHIMEVYGRGSLMRVVYGMATLLNPANKIVDPNLDTLDHHPDTIKIQSERDELLVALKNLVGVCSVSKNSDYQHMNNARQLIDEIGA